MSDFIHKWANMGQPSKPSALKPLTAPTATSAGSSPSLSAAKAGKPSPQDVKNVNTSPALMAPSTMLPPVSNQAAAVAQGSGDVSTNTQGNNYAKMAEVMLELMKSGSLTENILSMRPR